MAGDEEDEGDDALFIMSFFLFCTRNLELLSSSSSADGTM